MNLKSINTKNYPPVIVLWLITGCASTLFGAFTNSVLLLGVGAGVLILLAAYTQSQFSWNKKQKNGDVKQ